MHSKEEVAVFLRCRERGMGVAEAAEFAGVPARTAAKWSAGALPHSAAGRALPAGGARMGAKRPRGKAPAMDERSSGLYEPAERGPLSGLTPDQVENLLLRAVLADLKAGGWDPASISSRSKCELGERLRAATGQPLRSITRFLGMSKSSCEYHRARLGRDRDADIRAGVVRLFREGRGAWGYRTIWARLRAAGTRASEKRVRRVMREEGLEVVYDRRRRRGHGSYAGEVSRAPENLVARRFRASAPDELWLTDITEFALPGGRKACLSPVVDCFDGRPAAWSVGTSPTAELANSSLLKAIAQRRPGPARPSTPTAAGTTAGRGGSPSARSTAWPGACRPRGAARTTRPARGSSGASRTSSSTTATGGASAQRSSCGAWRSTSSTIGRGASSARWAG